MSKIVKKKIISDSAIVVEDVASMTLDESRLASLKRAMDNDSNATLKLINGVLVYEVERVIPLNADEWEKLAEDVTMSSVDEALEDIAIVEETTKDSDDEPIKLPEYPAVEALKNLLF